MLQKGEKFSITTDEWTSISGRRFMNINIHGKDKFVKNLGLIRITGSFTATAALTTLEKHLTSDGIELSKDIFAITADGAVVMKK